jgi:hypothetical protein
MASIGMDTIQRLWGKTSDFSWNSLRQGLDRILSEQIISEDEYQRINWAINHLENLGEPFPESASDLYSELSHYL